MSDRGHSAKAQPAKQKTPTRRKTPQVSSTNVIPAVSEQRLLLKESIEDQNYETFFLQLHRSAFLIKPALLHCRPT